MAGVLTDAGAAVKAPPCEFCGRRDTSFTSLWVRAQRTIRNQRGVIRALRHDVAVATAAAEHHRAHVADLEAKVRRLDETLDFLSMGRTRAMERGES